MCALGEGFLRGYYNSILACPVSAVLCMVDERYSVIGFTVCSVDTRSQFEFLEKRRLHLMISMLGALARRPSLLPGVLQRRRMMKGSTSAGDFVMRDGARNEFLALSPERRNGPNAMILMKKTLDLMRVFDIKELWIEVDSDNVRATRFHEMLKARHVRQAILPSGKTRQIMCYSL